MASWINFTKITKQFSFMVYTDLHYFGALTYYNAFAGTERIVFDTQAAFSKMSFKNRMVIASAQGPLHLTIPVVGGRDQKTPMDQMRISYESKWQSQHFKSIYTNYKRAPFFEYYVDSLKLLYATEYEFLNDFLLATQNWTKQQLKAKWEIETVASNLDLSNVPKWIDPFKPNNFQSATNRFQYQQVFDHATGFIPNLCILDVLFAMGGKQALNLLSEK
ncbi:MAG: WbqC family protein [Sediminibacterium sp.]|nr:WbqC family protein [Sediminibacterium sp.]